MLWKIFSSCMALDNKYIINNKKRKAMITDEEFFEELKAAGFNVLCPGESPGERANEISVMSDIDFKVNPDYNIEEDPNLEVIIPKYLCDLID